MRYYSTLRPVAPGSYPMTDKVVKIENYDDRTFIDEISHEAWGYIEYSEELPEEIAASYDLIKAGVKTWYAVTSSFYDNGKVRAAITDTINATVKPESAYKELKRCDVYVDYYDTKEAAEQAVKDALSA